MIWSSDHFVFLWRFMKKNYQLLMDEEISKLNIPSSDDYYQKDAIDGMLGEINNTLGEINNTLGQALNKTIEILG